MSYPNGYVPRTHTDVCICLIDIVTFSTWCVGKTPSDIFHRMTKYNKFLSKIMENHAFLDKIELVGDSVLIVSCLDVDTTPNIRVVNVLRMCLEILGNIETLRQDVFEHDISLRIGVHLGDIHSGFIENPIKFQIFGNSINIASRLESNSLPGTLSISEEAYGVVENKEEFMEIGKMKVSTMKGVGAVKFRMMCLHIKKCLIADDDATCRSIFEKMIEKRYELSSILVDNINDTFLKMKQNTYEFCILDINFADSCVFWGLLEFRNWEGIYRNTRQTILLTSTGIFDDAKREYVDLIDAYIDKENIYKTSSYPVL